MFLQRNLRLDKNQQDHITYLRRQNITIEIFLLLSVLFLSACDVDTVLYLQRNLRPSKEHRTTSLPD